jgi:hypothetical protein
MRVGPTTGTYTVGYALAGVTATAGADFVATGGTLTFGPGITSRVISVPIVADTLNEPAETFTVTLSGPSAGAVLGTPSVATVTITDDDPAGAVQFAASQYAVTEGWSGHADGDTNGHGRSGDGGVRDEAWHCRRRRLWRTERHADIRRRRDDPHADRHRSE